MDYAVIIEQLEQFRELLDRHNESKYSSTSEARALANEVYLMYGELEEVFDLFLGTSQISVPSARGGTNSIYKNYIEAGYLSGRTIHAHEGYTQLQKVIGKVRHLLKYPSNQSARGSLTTQKDVVDILSRFRECCQYLTPSPDNERSVQDIAWIMLRSHFDNVKREDTLPRFGVKNYRPDFGIPEVGLYVEIKFIGPRTRLADVQEELLADIPGYLAADSSYDAILICIYDSSHKLRNPNAFIDDIRSVDGILDVIVIPGIG